MVGRGEGDAVAAGKRMMWVCDSCKGVYYAPINDRCPGCKGLGKERMVLIDASGVAHVPPSD